MERLADLGVRGPDWLLKVRDKLKNAPFVSNIVFTVVLVCLEKLVEIEFSCPCDHGWNIAVVVLYFLVPAFLISMLMCFMLEFQFYDKNNYCGLNWLRSAFICSIPAIVWITLLFFDGRYVACAATDWSGMYVTIDKNVNKKWCDPTNNSVSELRKTQRWFGVSQFLGLLFLIFIIVLILTYKFCRMYREASGEQSTQDSIEMLHDKLQAIEKAARELQKAAEDVVNKSAAKRAEAMKQLADAAEAAVAAVAAAKTVAVAFPTAATESAGAEAGEQVSPSPGNSMEMQSAPQQ